MRSPRNRQPPLRAAPPRYGLTWRTYVVNAPAGFTAAWAIIKLFLDPVVCRKVSILGELGKQRETLLHAKGSLSGASEGLEQSRRVLRSMGRRAMANKLVLWVVIALIGALILVVLYTEVVPAGAPSAAAAPPPKLTDDANEWRVVKGK